MVLSRWKYKEIRKLFKPMASVGVAPTSGMREPSSHNIGVDRLPEEMNDMKIRDDKVSTELVWHYSLLFTLFFLFGLY